MITRPTLNGLEPRTARDLRRDPFDWIEGANASQVLGAGGAMRGALSTLNERAHLRATLEARAAYHAFFARLAGHGRRSSAGTTVAVTGEPSRLAKRRPPFIARLLSLWRFP